MINVRQTTDEDYVAAMVNCLPIFCTDAQDLVPHMVTVHCGDAILGLFTANRIWPGVVTFGAILTEYIYDHPVSFTRFVKKYLNQFEQQGIHRMQIDVRTDYTAGHAFARALGFKPEGVMKMYGQNKKDYTLYARTC